MSQFKFKSSILGFATLFISTSTGATETQSFTHFNEVSPEASVTHFSPELIAELPTDMSTGEVLNQIHQYNGQSRPLNQVTNVNQLRDVSPGDWAFEALRNLVERYGCIAGYPSGVYLGNRAMTRYEFAAGLNACLGQIERLIASSTTDFITRDDLATLEQLVAQFEGELATLGTRVDDLEGRVATLEGNQFSTTTKLKGEAIFALAGAFGDEQADSTDDIQDNITLSDRVRLHFDASFVGKDRLRVRLQAGNNPQLDSATGTDTARLGFEATGGNNVDLTDLYYKFPLGSRVTGYVGTSSLGINNIFDVHNPFFGSSSSGALSRLNRRNPLIYRAPSGAGGGLKFKLSDNISITGLYLTDDADEPTDENGLFDGAYSAGAQLDIDISDAFEIGFTYLNTYEPVGDANLSGSTIELDRPFNGGSAAATSGNRYGISANWRVSQNLNIGGNVAYADIEAESGVDEGESADIWSWTAHLAIPDFGKEGNVLGFLVGMPPRITDTDGSGDEASDTTLLVEALYKYKVNKNILITPGAYVIFNPEHNDDNDTIWVGVVRTTFKF